MEEARGRDSDHQNDVSYSHFSEPDTRISSEMIVAGATLEKDGAGCIAENTNDGLQQFEGSGGGIIFIEGRIGEELADQTLQASLYTFWFSIFLLLNLKWRYLHRLNRFSGQMLS
jgi:hypothetical protein